MVPQEFPKRNAAQGILEIMAKYRISSGVLPPKRLKSGKRHPIAGSKNSAYFCRFNADLQFWYKPPTQSPIQQMG
jgi:hypothetical protein